MGMATSLLMYEDIRLVMDEALSRDIGLEIVFETKGQAIQFRQRCYTYRRLHGTTTGSAFGKDDPRSKESIYDALFISIKGNVLEMRRRDAMLYQVRELKE